MFSRYRRHFGEQETVPLCGLPVEFAIRTLTLVLDWHLGSSLNSIQAQWVIIRRSSCTTSFISFVNCWRPYISISSQRRATSGAHRSAYLPPAPAIFLGTPPVSGLGVSNHLGDLRYGEPSKGHIDH